MAGKGRPGPESLATRDAREFRGTVLAERSAAPGEGYRGAYEIIIDWHASEGHIGAFRHCHIRPCYDVRIGGAR